jgi:hypothetical protein
LQTLAYIRLVEENFENKDEKVVGLIILGYPKRYSRYLD